LFPKVKNSFKDLSLVEIAKKYLEIKGYKPASFDSEQEARRNVERIMGNNQWPCFYFNSDTSGEKKIEEFYTSDEIINMDQFKTIGIIKFNRKDEIKKGFLEEYQTIINKGNWKKHDFVKLFKKYLKNFSHDEKFKDLDQKM